MIAKVLEFCDSCQRFVERGNHRHHPELERVYGIKVVEEATPMTQTLGMYLR